VPFDAENLKKQLLFEKQLNVLWDLFMDATEEPEFIRDGIPARDQELCGRLRAFFEAALKTSPVKATIFGMDFFEAVPGELYHGPVLLSTGLAGLFYFKSLNAGCIAIPTALPAPQPNYVFARFSVDWKLKMAAKMM
jgi:hypothetical protein